MNRRAFLHAVGGTALLSAGAGCTFRAGGNGLELEEVDSLARYAAAQPADFTDEQRTAIDAALPDSEYVTYGYRPFPDGAYLQTDGAFYQANVPETGSKRLSRKVLGADEVDDTEDAVTIDEYPESDREPIVVACRFDLSRESDSDRGDRSGDRYVYVFRTTAEEETSLLPTPEHEVVEFEGRSMALWVEERELDEDEYTTTLAHVASSAREFERQIEDEYVVDLDEHDLTEEQLAILDTAIEADGYREQGRISDSLDDLIDLLYDEAPRGDAVIRYEGDYYTWDYRHSD